MTRAGLLALEFAPSQFSATNFAGRVRRSPSFCQALWLQPLTTARRSRAALSDRCLRPPEAGGSLRLTNNSKVHTPIESNTSFGRLVSWIDRFRLSAHTTKQVDHRGESSRRYARIAKHLLVADPRRRKRLPEFPVLCHAEYRREPFIPVAREGSSRRVFHCDRSFAA